MGNSSKIALVHLGNTSLHSAGNLLLLSEDWSQSADLRGQRASNMLRLVRNQVFNASHDLIKKGITVNQGAEAWKVSDLAVLTQRDTNLEFGRQSQFAPQLQYLLEASQMPAPNHESRLRHLRLSRSFRKVSTHKQYYSTMIEQKLPSQTCPPPYISLSSSCLRTDYEGTSEVCHG